MKTKWLKAIRSLKPASSTSFLERRNGTEGTQSIRPNENGSHSLQEYTYKRITPCDVCSQILRGHTRQGLRCRICKMNSHADCSSQLPKCQVKQKLLRQQKSTSELDNRPGGEEKTQYSPPRQKLNPRMKSLSLDSTESQEFHYHPKRVQPSAGPSRSYHGVSSVQRTPPSDKSRLYANPLKQIKFDYTNIGPTTESVDLPNEVEKSLPSGSSTPCPSPVRLLQKSHRQLPTNIYIILYNFKARHDDELDLKAGHKVAVIDRSDPDWWKGECAGHIGYFPSKYCTRLNDGEKPLQVTDNIQVAETNRSENMHLLRDQIVMQVGEEVDGVIKVRAANNQQGVCPVKYLQQV